MNKQFYDVEFTDYQNCHEFLVKLNAYEICKFEENVNDFPFLPEILSRSFYKGTINYIVRIHNLLYNNNED